MYRRNYARYVWTGQTAAQHRQLSDYNVTDQIHCVCCHSTVSCTSKSSMAHNGALHPNKLQAAPQLSLHTATLTACTR